MLLISVFLVPAFQKGYRDNDGYKRQQLPVHPAALLGPFFIFVPAHGVGQVSDEFERRIERLEQIVAGQDKKLDEVLTLLHASKLGLAALRWLIMLGVSLVGAWAAYKGVGK